MSRLRNVRADDRGIACFLDAARLRVLEEEIVRLADVIAACLYFKGCSDCVSAHPEIYLRVRFALTTVYLSRLIRKDLFERREGFDLVMQATDILIDCAVTVQPGIPPRKCAPYYPSIIKWLPLRVNEIAIHFACDDETHVATSDRMTRGPGWRRRKFGCFARCAIENALDTEAIELLTWREFGQRRQEECVPRLGLPEVQ